MVFLRWKMKNCFNQEFSAIDFSMASYFCYYVYSVNVDVSVWMCFSGNIHEAITGILFFVFGNLIPKCFNRVEKKGQNKNKTNVGLSSDNYTFLVFIYLFFFIYVPICKFHFDPDYTEIFFTSSTFFRIFAVLFLSNFFSIYIFAVSLQLL